MNKNKIEKTATTKTVGVGKFIDGSFTRKGEVHAERFWILLPHDLVHHKDFPFNTNLEPCVVRLENGKVVVSKLE
jgi:hypothetical protein